jgi:hypothetical protein
MQAQSSSSAMLRVCFDPRSREATIAEAIAISRFSAFAPFLLTSPPLCLAFSHFLPGAEVKKFITSGGRLIFLNIITAQGDIKKSEVPAEVTVSLFFKPVIIIFPHEYLEGLKKFQKNAIDATA